MVHPDYQYTPKIIPAMASLLRAACTTACSARASLAVGALEGGMPWWRYVSNRALTLVGKHPPRRQGSPSFTTGYRAYSRSLLERLPLDANSDDFVFDNQTDC